MAYWRVDVKRSVGADSHFDLRSQSTITAGDDGDCDICISTVDIPSQMKLIQKRFGKVYIRLTDEVLPTLEGNFERHKTWKNRLYSGATIRAKERVRFKIGDASIELRPHEKVPLARLLVDRGLEKKHWLQATAGSLVSHGFLLALFMLTAFLASRSKATLEKPDIQKVSIADARKIFEKPKPQLPEHSIDASESVTRQKREPQQNEPDTAAPLIAKKAPAATKKPLEEMGILALQTVAQAHKSNVNLAELSQGLSPHSTPVNPQSLDLGLDKGRDRFTITQGLEGTQELSSMKSSHLQAYQGGLSDKVLKGAQRAASVKLIKREVEVRGGLEAAVIRQIIEEREPEVKYCYENALFKKDGIEGKLAAAWTILADGSVADLTLQSDDITEGVLKKCIQDQMKGWKFPQPKGGGVVHVKYPFLFSLM